MPTNEDTATLIIACKNHASEQIERYTQSVLRADEHSRKLLETVRGFDRLDFKGFDFSHLTQGLEKSEVALSRLKGEFTKGIRLEISTDAIKSPEIDTSGACNSLSALLASMNHLPETANTAKAGIIVLSKSMLGLEDNALKAGKALATLENSRFAKTATEFDTTTQAAQRLQQTISRAKQPLDEKQAAILRNLHTEKLVADAEAADILSGTAAHKAYVAQLKLEAEQKRLNAAIRRGAEKREIDALTDSVAKLNEQYAKARQLEGKANLKAFTTDAAAKGFDIPKIDSGASEALKTLKTGADIAGEGVEKLTLKMLAAKAAGRALGVSVGKGVSPELIKLGIISAGAMAAIKIFKAGYDAIYFQPLRDKLDFAELNTKELDNSIANFKRLSGEQDRALSSLSRLQEKEKLSNVDRMESSKLISQLGNDFARYGIEIDNTTGKIKDFSKAQAALQENNRQREIRLLDSSIREIKSQQELLRQQSDVSAWDDIVTGGKAGNEAVAAATKRLELFNKLNELIRRRNELAKQTPLADAEAKNKAAVADLKQSFADQIKEYDRRYQIQKLNISGMEREAYWQETLNKLTKQNPKYTKEQIAELAKLEMRSYDTAEAHKAAKKAAEDSAKAQSERSRKAIEAAKAEAKFMQDIAKTFDKLKSTAQDAVMANSIDAVRLQSRTFLNRSGLDSFFKGKTSATAPAAQSTVVPKITMPDLPKPTAPAAQRIEFIQTQAQTTGNTALVKPSIQRTDATGNNREIVSSMKTLVETNKQILNEVQRERAKIEELYNKVNSIGISTAG